MPADTTGLYFLCPFCDEPFPSAREVRKHVTDTEEGEHHKINGFEMERTIVTTFNPYARLTMTEKIIEAGKKLGEPLDQNDAQIVSEESDEPKNKILRVWNDSDLETDVPNRSKIKWDDLYEKQEDALLYYYFNREKLELSEIAEYTEYASTSSLKRAIHNNGWLLEDEFAPDDIEDYAIKYRISTIPSSDVEETEEDLLNILDKCEVDYIVTISFQEERFDVITKLIENGYKDIAEQAYNQDTLEYKK